MFLDSKKGDGDLPVQTIVLILLGVLLFILFFVVMRKRLLGVLG